MIKILHLISSWFGAVVFPLLVRQHRGLWYFVCFVFRFSNQTIKIEFSINWICSFGFCEFLEVKSGSHRFEVRIKHSLGVWPRILKISHHVISAECFATLSCTFSAAKSKFKSLGLYEIQSIVGIVQRQSKWYHSIAAHACAGNHNVADANEWQCPFQ